MLDAIRKVIRDYHYALDMRQHGGVAQGTAFNAIQNILSMPWVAGREKQDREDPLYIHGTGIEPLTVVSATGEVVSEEAMEKIRASIQRTYVGVSNAEKPEILPEGEFVDSRPVDYKRWLPRIIRDLVRRRTI